MSIRYIKSITPNIISLSRLVFALPAAFYFAKSPKGIFLFFLIFQVIGDRLDGYLARRWQAISAEGKVFDTLADIGFFLGIYGVAISNPIYYPFYLFFVPGLIIGGVALMIRMVLLRKSFYFPPRPINHVSFLLYGAIFFLIYATGSPYTLAMTTVAGGAILISAIMLFYRLRV